MNYSNTFRTELYDLDWNRHVTSRTYERFCNAARFSGLEKMGYPLQRMLDESLHMVPGAMKVRFLAQQFAGAELDIETDVKQDATGKLQWDQVVRNGEKDVCTFTSTGFLQNSEKEILLNNRNDVTESPVLVESLWQPEFSESEHNSVLEYQFPVSYSDMNIFWQINQEAIWKYFEEGRFRFFNTVFSLDMVHKMDTSTFFMGGDLEICKLPEPGTKAILTSWIESIEKIRFYFRQNIVDSEGNVLARMRDEQLFVSLSKSRPRKAPPEFIEQVKAYTA